MDDTTYWYTFGAASLDELFDSEKLLETGRVERWGHRAQIHHREEDDELYVVVRGNVETSDAQVRLRPGDLFGMRQVGAPPAFRGYDETTVVALDRSTFEELVRPSGLVLSARARSGVRLVDVSIELPFDRVLGSGATERMARSLHEVARVAGEVDGDRARLPNLKPRHLSALAALDRAAGRRSFNALVDATLVESPAGSLVIPSISQLLQTLEDLS